MKVVELPIQPRNQSVVEFLEEALEDAKSGQTQGMVVVRFQSDRCFTVKRVGTMSDLEVCGALTFAQHDVMMANKPK